MSDHFIFSVLDIVRLLSHMMNSFDIQNLLSVNQATFELRHHFTCHRFTQLHHIRAAFLLCFTNIACRKIPSTCQHLKSMFLILDDLNPWLHVPVNLTKLTLCWNFYALNDCHIHQQVFFNKRCKIKFSSQFNCHREDADYHVHTSQTMSLIIQDILDQLPHVQDLTLIIKGEKMKDLQIRFSSTIKRLTLNVSLKKLPVSLEYLDCGIYYHHNMILDERFVHLKELIIHNHMAHHYDFTKLIHLQRLTVKKSLAIQGLPASLIYLRIDKIINNAHLINNDHVEELRIDEYCDEILNLPHIKRLHIKCGSELQHFNLRNLTHLTWYYNDIFIRSFNLKLEHLIYLNHQGNNNIAFYLENFPNLKEIHSECNSCMIGTQNSTIERMFFRYYINLQSPYFDLPNTLQTLYIKYLDNPLNVPKSVRSLRIQDSANYYTITQSD